MPFSTCCAIDAAAHRITLGSSRRRKVTLLIIACSCGSDTLGIKSSVGIRVAAVVLKASELIVLACIAILYSSSS